MSINLEFTKSNNFKTTVSVIGAVLLAVIIFNAGIAVGFHKARFASNWNGNYERNFGFDRSGDREVANSLRDRKFFDRDKLRKFENNILPPMPDRPGGMMNPHGVAGEVLSLATSSMIIRDIDGIEKTVNFASSTEVSMGWQKVNHSSIKKNDRIMVIGEANDLGQVESRFIRIMPK